jgi:hypothetical protein
MEKLSNGNFFRWIFDDISLFYLKEFLIDVAEVDAI